MNSDVIREAYFRLFNEEPDFDLSIRFSRKFKDYNANVRKSGKKILFSLSNSWRQVNEEILIGLIQHLFLRILGRKTIRVRNVSLYLSFLQNLDLAAVKTVSDPLLLELFKELNETYFNNLMETPGIEWGLNSKSVMANYNCKNDTITVNSLFKDAGKELLRYLLYHEMLHKKLKFKSSRSGKIIHHGSEFKKLEKSFPNQKILEKRLDLYLGKKVRKPKKVRRNVKQMVMDLFR